MNSEADCVDLSDRHHLSSVLCFHAVFMDMNSAGLEKYLQSVWNSEIYICFKRSCNCEFYDIHMFHMI
jgi:hypothetical protein